MIELGILLWAAGPRESAVEQTWVKPVEGNSEQSKLQRSSGDAARLSGGKSGLYLYQLAVSGLEEELARAQAVLDLGCGQGKFGEFLRKTYSKRLDGIDIVAYAGFRGESYNHFAIADLNREVGLFPGSSVYDLIFAVEVIEHQENPRHFCRLAAKQLNRGGTLVLTTPNCTSLSSTLTFVMQGVFRDFRDGQGMYPTHITPVLPIDAMRIMKECGLEVVSISYSNFGRIPLSGKLYQSILPFLGGKLFSDNYRIVGRSLS